MVGGGVVGILSIVAGIVEWIDRRTEPQIMRQRVNDGSDEFLLNRESPFEEGRRSVRDFLNHLGG